MAGEVTTPSGVLRGAKSGRGMAFRGVPYARAPIGDRRLAFPEPPDAWSGERDVRAWSASPPQSVEPLIEMLGLAPASPTDEDCLYLNIWTPAADDARRPVLVWIPGGAFIGGTACSPVYDGARLSERGDVVVVTLSYRVGLLGFGWVDGAPANLGLHDQIAALRWVREEIAHFGGDPKRVTVFGESAGAGSVAALLAMPDAAGLFRRAIIQSAAPEGMIRPDEADRRAELLAARLGIPGLRRDRLAALDVESIVRAQRECAALDGPFQHNMLFVPVVDGDCLPSLPIEAARDGRTHPVDLIIGTTRQEMRLYAREPLVADLDEAGLAEYVSRGHPRAEEVIASYRREAVQAGEADAPADLFMAIESDRLLRAPAARLAGVHALGHPSTWMYQFTWASRLFDGLLGSCHALDLGFTFGNLDAPGIERFAGGGPTARRLSDRLMDAWCAFARHGDPAHPDLPAWPPYGAPRRATMLLGEPCELREAPGEAGRALWDESA